MGIQRLVELHGLGFSFVGKWKNLPKLMEFTVSWGFQRIRATSHKFLFISVVWSGLKSIRRCPFHLSSLDCCRGSPKWRAPEHLDDEVHICSIKIGGCQQIFCPWCHHLYKFSQDLPKISTGAKSSWCLHWSLPRDFHMDFPWHPRSGRPPHWPTRGLSG